MNATNEDYEIAKKMYTEGKSTLEVQTYFCKKYNLPRLSMAANFIKKVRRHLGIYKSTKQKKGNNDAEQCTRPLQD